jgi:hypothetical protein
MDVVSHALQGSVDIVTAFVRIGHHFVAHLFPFGTLSAPNRMSLSIQAGLSFGLILSRISFERINGY